MKKAALVCASDFNQQEFLRLHAQCPFTEIVAVDGGYSHLLVAGVAPTRALGDFDSLGFVPHGVPVVTFPEEKDDSDLGLALSWAAQQPFDLVFVYGAFAGRPDHTMASYQAMAGYAQQAGRPVVGVADNSYIAVVPPYWQIQFTAAQWNPATMAGPKDNRAVSFFSLGDQAGPLSLTGFKYEGCNIMLSCTNTLGLSNELKEAECIMASQGGLVLAFWPLAAGLPIFSLSK